MPEEIVGKIAGYFKKIDVAAIDITHGILKVGDTIHIHGHTTDLTQKVESMQIEHEQVQEAKAGNSIGIRVNGAVRHNDAVYKVV